MFYKPASDMQMYMRQNDTLGPTVYHGKASRANSEHQKAPRHCERCHWEILEIAAVTFTHVDAYQEYSENYKGESEWNWVTTRLNQSVDGHQCSHELVGVQNQKPLKILTVPHGDIRC